MRSRNRIPLLANLALALSFAIFAPLAAAADDDQKSGLSPEADAFLASCTAEFNTKQEKFHEQWVNDSDAWNADLEKGVLYLQKKGKTFVTFDVETVGSYSATDQNWEWAWNNPNVKKSVAVPRAALQDLAEKYDLFYLRRGFVPITDDMMPYYLSSIALKVRGALGVYVAEHEDLKIFLLVRNPR